MLSNIPLQRISLIIFFSCFLLAPAKGMEEGAEDLDPLSYPAAKKEGKIKSLKRKKTDPQEENKEHSISLEGSPLKFKETKNHPHKKSKRETSSLSEETKKKEAAFSQLSSKKLKALKRGLNRERTELNLSELQCYKLKAIDIRLAKIFILNNFPTLTHLSLSWPSSRSTRHEIGQLLSSIPTLTCLSLIDEDILYLREKDVKFIASLTTLKSLSLRLVELGNEGIIALTSLSALTHLDLARNNIGNKGVVTLAGINTLTYLDLSGNRVGPEGVEVLASHPNLLSLILANNGARDAGAKALALNETLTHLDIKRNRIKDEGIKALALCPTIKLLSLDLEGNEFGREGIEALAANTTIKSLFVGYNKLGNDEAAVLAGNTTLKLLDLSGNRIGEEGAQILAQNSTYNTLNLEGNGLGVEGAKALFSIKTLTSLNLRDNKIGKEGAIELMACLESHPSLTELKGLSWPGLGSKIKNILECNKVFSGGEKLSEQKEEFPLTTSSPRRDEDLEETEEKTDVPPLANIEEKEVSFLNEKIEKRSLSSLETFLHKKAKFKRKDRLHDLADLYWNVSQGFFDHHLAKEYSDKALIIYHNLASQNETKGQNSLLSLFERGFYNGRLDEEAMGWFKDALKRADQEVDDFLSQVSDDNPDLLFSDLIFINLEERIAPTIFKWGAFEINKIYKPLYCVSDSFLSKYEDAVMAIDPSSTGQCETAYCIAKRCGNYYFITAIGGMAGGYEPAESKKRVGNNDQIISNLVNAAHEHKVNHVVIEVNNDASFPRLLKGQGLNSAIYSLKQGSRKSKCERIVDTFAPLLQNHQLVIDRKVLQEDFDSKPQNDIRYKFFYQFMHVNRTLHDFKPVDRLDAAEMALSYLVTKKAKQKLADYYEKVLE